MHASLLSQAQDALGGDFSKLAGQFLGEPQAAAQSALGSLLPAVLGGIAQKGATVQGASGLMSLLAGANLDVASLGHIAGLFGNGGTGMNALLKTGTRSLVPALFGDKSGALANALASASGIKGASATTLLAMVVPLILTFLKKVIADRGLDAGSLSALLSSQGPSLQGALDRRMTGALGFASPAAFVGEFAGQAADAARRTAVASVASMAGSAAAAATPAGKSGPMRWLPWIIAAAVLLWLWTLLAGKPPAAPAPTAPAAALTAPAPKLAPAPARAPAPAPAPALAATAIALPAKVYFEVGATTLGDDAGKTVAAVAGMIRKDKLKVALTGYTDKTGDPATNEALAKRRAAAVRDALGAAGVGPGSVRMKPPRFVEAGAGGSDAEARRVEINRQ